MEQDGSQLSLRDQVRALGTSFDAWVNVRTRDIYRPFVCLEQAGQEWLDLAYGLDPRHRLDLYVPGVRSRGTVVFIHGGGFVGGDKNSDGVFYVNVGRWLARNGWAAILPNYRRAPDHVWPAGARDLQAVILWARAHLADWASHDSPVVVWGQSAGASHVASWMFDRVARGGDRPKVSGVVLMSGVYAAVEPLGAGPLAYFGADASAYAARSAVNHVCPEEMPFWLTVAELDPPAFRQQAVMLETALRKAGCARLDVATLMDHNHVSTVQSLGSPQDDVAMDVLRFLSNVEQATAASRE